MSEEESKEGFELSDEEKSVMAEVVNIGMGHASTALNQLLHSKIDIALPEVTICPLNQVQKYFGSEEVLLGVILRVVGELEGTLLYLFKKADAHKMLQMVIGETKGEDTSILTDDYEVSTIKEVANIMSGSYLNALSRFIDIHMVPSIPHLVFDTAPSIFGLAALGEKRNVELMIVKSTLSLNEGDVHVSGNLILILRSDQFKSFFKQISKKYGENLESSS